MAVLGAKVEPRAGNYLQQNYITSDPGSRLSAAYAPILEAKPPAESFGTEAEARHWEVRHNLQQQFKTSDPGSKISMACLVQQRGRPS